MSRPHISILGSGPTGLDAALAAATHDLSFTLYEAGDRVADYMRRWGHVRLFSPWDLDVSPRMRKALANLGLDAPTGDLCPTGNELADRVFEPLAESPSIAAHLRLGTRVTAIGREGLLKSSAIGDPIRGEHRFRLLIEDRNGDTRTENADVVLDCTGNYGHPNWTGDGGIPAPGESELGDRIVRTLQDFDADADAWSGRRTLLVGAGHSAQTAICDLARFAETHPGTEVVWAVRRERPEWEILEEDPLPSRADLLRRAQALAQGGSPHVRCETGAVVDVMATDGDRVHVTLRHADGRRSGEAVDRVVSLTGYVGDHQLYRQLQVHECYATCGPMKLAASLLSDSTADCLDQTSHGAETLINPEPGFFILGSKSYGRNSNFLMRVGWQQVDEVFALVRSRAA